MAYRNEGESCCSCGMFFTILKNVEHQQKRISEININLIKLLPLLQPVHHKPTPAVMNIQTVAARTMQDRGARSCPPRKPLGKSGIIENCINFNFQWKFSIPNFGTHFISPSSHEFSQFPQ